VDYTLERFEQELRKQFGELSGEMKRMRDRKAELEKEVARLTAGLASGLFSVTVTGEIARREGEIRDITDRLLSSKPESIHSRIMAVREKSLERISQLREYLTRDPVTSRNCLLRHLEKIVMEPNRTYYFTSGNYDLPGVGRWECAEGWIRPACDS
jgi:chromosome segregation ATPase